MLLPKNFNVESDKGYFSINGAGGSGMMLIFQYSLRDTINSIYEGALYYDYNIHGDGQCHEYTLVQNQGYMSFHLDGQKLEPPTSLGDDETTSVALKYILSGENSKMQLDCSGIRMIEFKMFDTALEVEDCSDISIVKVFLWDSLTGMKPQLNSLEYQIQQKDRERFFFPCIVCYLPDIPASSVRFLGILMFPSKEPYVICKRRFFAFETCQD